MVHISLNNFSWLNHLINGALPCAIYSGIECVFPPNLPNCLQYRNWVAYKKGYQDFGWEPSQQTPILINLTVCWVVQGLYVSNCVRTGWKHILEVWDKCTASIVALDAGI